MQPQSQLGIFNYDVFISYKSEEESWAKRIAETLRQFGLRVWRDHDAGDGIRAGEKWSDSIRNGIRASKVMIVLWSKLARDNYAQSVIQEEIEEMDRLVKNDSTGRRRIVPILLDDAAIANHPKLGSYQGDLSFQDSYNAHRAGGAAKVKAIDWYGMIKALIETLGIEDVTEIRFVVAAMSRKQAEELRDDPQKFAKDGNILNLMCQMMQVTSSQFDVTRYGDTPNDWQPLPQMPNVSINDIVNAYSENKRNDALSRKEYVKWIVVSYSDQVLSKNPQERQGALQVIQKGPCLVIVDPLSLIHKDVYDYVITEASLHNQQEAFFIGVSPFVTRKHKDMVAAISDIDTGLEGLMKSVYNHFGKPFDTDTRACVMNVEHEMHFFRWLQIAADRIVLANRTPLLARNPAVNPAMLKLMQSLASTKPLPRIIDMSGR